MKTLIYISLDVVLLIIIFIVQYFLTKVCF